jgi:hypothetical protein
MYREAVIEPTANLNQLDELFIVLGPKQPATQPSDNSDTNAAPSNSAPPAADNATPPPSDNATTR